MTTHTRTLAVLITGVLTLGLTACGGDDDQDHEAGTTRLTPTLNADSEESTTTEDVAQDFDGFSTPRERDAALTVYACQRMADYDAAEVVKNAFDEVKTSEVLSTSLWSDPEEKKQAGQDQLTATLGKYDPSQTWTSTCDEASPYYRTWIKAGWAQYLDSTMTFTKAVADATGAAEGDQYARELSGEARSIINP
jgi:hypothetical protein